ncbi:hypothetical protein JL993_03040 [Staphylococcus pseudintermedius]|nr:hypothetical protein [Staphylococcus pseudintermedius]MCE5718831.1 hypothetical protein [Staphylococcus pseudintermedius]
MSGNIQENHSKQGTSTEVINYATTGYSNSRLGVHSVHPLIQSLSLDALTIVGNLNKNSAEKLSKFMSVEPQIRLWNNFDLNLHFDM